MIVNKLGDAYTLEASIEDIEVKGQILDYEVGFPAVILSIEDENGCLIHTHYSKDSSSDEYVFNVAANDNANISEYVSQLFTISVDAINEILNENKE